MRKIRNFKLNSLMLLLALAVFSSASLFAVTTVVPASSLSAESIKFLKKTFPNSEIWKVEKDIDKFYVTLANGAIVEFMPSGDWVSIKGEENIIPNKVLPSAVQKTVKNNFPNALIIGVDRSLGNYKVRLNNLIELYIAENGLLMEQKWYDPTIQGGTMVNSTNRKAETTTVPVETTTTSTNTAGTTRK